MQRAVVSSAEIVLIVNKIHLIIQLCNSLDQQIFPFQGSSSLNVLVGDFDPSMTE